MYVCMYGREPELEFPFPFALLKDILKSARET